MEEKQNLKSNNILIKIIVIIIVFFLGSACMYGLIYKFPTKFTTMTTKTIKDVTITENGISEAVDKIYDAVVIVENYKNNKLIGSGTGFVYKVGGDKAYILTNNHVISSGEEVTVIFTTKESKKAKIVGQDTYADIAVLEIDSFDDITIAITGSSDNAKIGDTVFAVGAPLDSVYSWTVTRGILSGKDRLVEVSSTNNSTSDWVMSVIQTDTAINSGNSGGPLANSNGEVIGITSMKLVSSGVEGMGFAIPIETALEYAAKFEKGEEITRPYLGVSMYNLSEVNKKYYDYEKITEGVYVASVEENSPADKAGIKEGDIITKINDTEVNSVAYLKYSLYKYNSNEKISITVYRDGNSKNIDVTLGTNS